MKMKKNKNRVWRALFGGAAACALALSFGFAAAKGGDDAKEKKPLQLVGVTLEEALIGIEGKYKRVKSVKADFKQIYYSQTTMQTTEGKGSMVFAKPNLMRWDYDGSPKKSFAYDGKTFYYADYEKKKLSKTKLISQKDLVLALEFLSGRGALSERFKLKLISESDFEKDIPTAGKIILELAPKDEGEQIAAMYLIINPLVYEVDEAVIYDLVGNRNRILFSAMRFDEKQSANFFKIETPKGWTVEEW